MWLCLDQGGHSTRAAVFDRRGAVVAESSEPVATFRPARDRVEHNAAELIGSMRRCIDAVGRQLGSHRTELLAAAIATQRSTLACVSRSGEILTPLISWQDRRGSDDLGRFEADAADIKRITGLRLSPHYGVGKIRWSLAHDARIREQLLRDDLIAAPLASLITHALCRERPWLVDPVNASRTLLMDLRSAAWSEQLLRLFDLPEAILPKIKPNRSRFGTLAVAQQAVPLTVLTGDQAAAIFALGEPADGTVFINIGTGAFIQAATGTAPVQDDGLLSSVVWQDARGLQYVLEGTVNGAASAIDAVSEELGLREAPESPALARALLEIERAPLYLNGVSGLGSPDWAPSFASRFVGEGDALACLAAAYESVAFLIQRNLDRLARCVPVKQLVVSGGLSRFDWLVQRIADLSGLVVVRPVDTEATLRGLAHVVSDGAIDGLRPSTDILPQADSSAERRYRDWTRALEAALRN